MWRRLAALSVLAILAGCLQGNQGEPIHDQILLAQASLLVEIDAFGVQPCPDAVSALVTHLRWIGANEDVELRIGHHAATDDDVHDNRDLRELAARHRDPVARSAHLHVLFVDGRAGGDGHTAGRTLAADGLIAIFPQTYAHAYRVHAGDARCDVERTVMLHELGHALGLVNRGVPMLSPREADDHAGHSTNPDSVMYPTLRLGSGGLLTDLPRGFDVHDLRDLSQYQASRSRP